MALNTWHKDGDWKAEKTIHIPAVPLDAASLPPLLQGFGAVPPVVTDIDLSLDDRFLYVACWGTGELRQYGVSDPFAPRLTSAVELGGILHRAKHPSGRSWGGGPQMIEVSRDGRRVYGTNSLYGSWDPQFYPDGRAGRHVQSRCRRRGRGPHARPRFPRRVPRASVPPDPPPRRRLLDRLILLRIGRTLDNSLVSPSRHDTVPLPVLGSLERSAQAADR